MSFTESTRTCLRKYATFGGRASRAEYWWFGLFAVVATSTAALLDAVAGTDWFFFLTLLAIALPVVAAGVRRLHDTGRSGWWHLLTLAPAVGEVVLMVLLALPGDEGSNRYGPATRVLSAADVEAAEFHRQARV